MRSFSERVVFLGHGTPGPYKWLQRRISQGHGVPCPFEIFN